MFIAIANGISGYYAALYDSSPEGGPIATGCGRYSTALGAAEEARDWAEAESVRLDSSVLQILGEDDSGSFKVIYADNGSNSRNLASSTKC